MNDRLIRNEMISQRKLAWILDNVDGLSKPLITKAETYRKGREWFREPVISQLKKMLYAINNDVLVSKFKQHDEGRLNACNSVSLQTTTRPVRHLLAEDNYTDIDIVNCHPVILEQLCKSKGISTPYLSEMVHHRDEIFEEIMAKNSMSKSDVKMIVLSLLYGGTASYTRVWYKPPRLVGFAQEIKWIMQKVCGLEKKLLQTITRRRKSKGKDFNHLGSCMSVILQRVENSILECMELYFERLCPLTSMIPVHDGMMIPKTDVDLKPHFEECQKFIFRETGYLVKIVQKEMTEHLGLTEYPEVYPEIQQVSKVRDFSKDDSIYDAVRYYSRKVFESKEDLLIDMVERLPRYVKFVMNPQVFVVNNGKNGFACQTTHLMKTCFMEGDVKRFKKEVDDLLGFALKPSNMALFALYERLVFTPHTGDWKQKDHPRDCNIFQGFKGATEDISPLNDTEIENIEPLLRHVKEVIASDDLDLYDYFLTYLAWIVQRPTEKTMIFMLLYSGQQQVGKNIIMKFISKYVIGREYAIERTGLSEILNEKNADFEKCLLCVVNEIVTDKYHSDFDRLKDLITSDRRRIRKLYQDPIELDNYTNYIGTSNSKFALRVEGKTDARMCCIEVSDRYKGNRSYFSKLASCFNNRCGELFYRFLLNYPINRDLREIPKTSLRTEMADFHPSSIVQFLTEIEGLTAEEIDNSRDFSTFAPEDTRRLVSRAVDHKGQIKVKMLYGIYTSWCHGTNEKALKYKFFTSEIKTKYKVFTIQHALVATLGVF